MAAMLWCIKRIIGCNWSIGPKDQVLRRTLYRPHIEKYQLSPITRRPRPLPQATVDDRKPQRNDEHPSKMETAQPFAE